MKILTQYITAIIRVFILSMTTKFRKEQIENLTSADVGLGNVDNTSDINKPVSTATQTALDDKADTTDLYILTSEASSATPTITGTALRNDYVATALAANAELAAPSGTPNARAVLRYELTASGATRTITRNAGLLAGNVTRFDTIDDTKTGVELYMRSGSTWVCVYSKIIN